MSDGHLVEKWELSLPIELRHTCATFLLANGVNLKIIRQILGHSSAKTKEICTKLVAEQLKGATDVLTF